MVAQPVDDFTLAVAYVLRREQARPGAPRLEEVVRRTNMSRSTVYHCLNGRRNITLSYLRELCAALDLEMDWVIREGQAETPLAP